METWSLPKARPISCNDCPAFQRLHMSTRWCAESFTRLRSVINTTFREKIYIRWCCIDRLSRHRFSGLGLLSSPLGTNFVVLMATGAYDARARSPNWKFRVETDDTRFERRPDSCLMTELLFWHPS